MKLPSSSNRSTVRMIVGAAIAGIAAVGVLVATLGQNPTPMAAADGGGTSTTMAEATTTTAGGATTTTAPAMTTTESPTTGASTTEAPTTKAVPTVPRADDSVTATLPRTTQPATSAATTTTTSTTVATSTTAAASTASVPVPSTTATSVMGDPSVPTTTPASRSEAPATPTATNACQTLWVDWNGDGKRTPDEDLLGGVTVKLSNPGPDGKVSTADDLTAKATTDANGRYCMTLPEGLYAMTIESGLPAKYADLQKGSLTVQVMGLQITRAPEGTKVVPIGSTPAPAPATPTAGGATAPAGNLPFTGARTRAQLFLALLAMAFGCWLFSVGRIRGRHRLQD